MGGGLTWFRYQVETPFHPKTQRLALILQVSDVYASGILVTLWSWAIRFAPDGDLTKFGAEFIEQRVLDGRSGVLAALGEVGFMDASGGRLGGRGESELQQTCTSFEGSRTADLGLAPGPSLCSAP